MPTIIIDHSLEHRPCKGDANGLWGFIDAHGDWVIRPQFEFMPEDFAVNSVARVYQNGQYGYINAHGDWVVHIKKMCDVDILQCRNGNVLWPKESSADLCAQAAYHQGKKSPISSLYATSDPVAYAFISVSG